MALPSVSTDRVLSIYLALAQYPILSTQIRARMRREIFDRGVITPQAFENEVRDYAIRSQAREALHNPFAEEPANVWELRLLRVRDHLTDFYFAYNLPYDLFEQIVRESLVERGVQAQDILVSFNPELAPLDMLFEQASSIEKMPAAQRLQAEARLYEIKVVLIRTLISDQLAYVNIAKDWFTIQDLSEIRRRKIGEGKIGGKAAGMLLAARILSDVGDEDIKASLRIPLSFFLGADLTYMFLTLNNLIHWGDQKYKSDEQIRADFPILRQDFLAGEFPADTLERLRELLDEVGKRPLIVRSSSLLEDNFGTSFAGKYESHFCPNQGTPDENMRSLTQAIQRIYASVFNPDALLYRRSKGLQDYDERMAILIQVVQGEQFGRYYMPQAAGVAFSRNLYRWSQQIRREDGFVRLVWGMGTRAVDRTGNDYPRLVALSHPLLHPEAAIKAIRRYSQQYVDLIDLKENTFTTLPVREVISPRYPAVRYIAEMDQEDYLVPLRSMLMDGGPGKLVLTFDELFRRTPLASMLRRMLQLLEKHYKAPVDTEFTIQISNQQAIQPELNIYLLQCRPQSHLKETSAHIPQALYPDDIIFSTRRMVPHGTIEGIRYVLFVKPEEYFALPTPSARLELGRAVGKLNALLGDQNYICVGPGRWGTTNPDLGVNIGYSDIYNTCALVELAGTGIGPAPEPSFGTHFFQDLVEANIYPLAIFLDDVDAVFNRLFFYDSPNRLLDFLPGETARAESLRLIDVGSFRPGYHLDLVMDDEQGRAVAYLAPSS
ncbi:MAG: PEP/pyruvate-binding domain-containing protein [Omnitrophica WOR_2 bacterium]